MSDPTEEELDGAVSRVGELVVELTRVVDRHMERNIDLGRDSVVADVRVAAVLLLKRVVEATCWDKFDVVNEVAEFVGLRVKVVTLRGSTGRPS